MIATSTGSLVVLI